MRQLLRLPGRSPKRDCRGGSGTAPNGSRATLQLTSYSGLTGDAASSSRMRRFPTNQKAAGKPEPIG